MWIIRIKSQTDITVDEISTDVPVEQATRIAILDETRKEIQMATLTQDNKRMLTTKAVDDSGKERMTDPTPYTWEAIPPGFVKLTPTPDGRSCDVVGLAVGSSTIKVTGDADPGSATVNIFGSVTVDVVSAMATKIEITIGPEGPNV